MAPDTKKTSIKAYYSSTVDSRNFELPIAVPVPSPQDADFTKSKSAFIGDVRAQTKKLQDQVNVFLTQKMEEDKTKAAPRTKTNGTRAHDGNEEAEEENYGEEKPGDD